MPRCCANVKLGWRHVEKISRSDTVTDKRYGVKRKHKRIPLRFGTDAPGKIAFTDDITHEGLFIRTGLVVAPGTRLVIELSPPEGRILLWAEVRWAKRIPPQMLHKMKGGMGVRILAFQDGESIYHQICDALYGRDS
jgi:hypothetical protein